MAAAALHQEGLENTNSCTRPRPVFRGSFQRRLAPSGIQQGLTKQTPLMVNDSFRARAEREESRAVVRQIDRAATRSPPGTPSFRSSWEHRERNQGAAHLSADRLVVPTLILFLMLQKPQLLQAFVPRI